LNFKFYTVLGMHYSDEDCVHLFFSYGIFRVLAFMKFGNLDL